MKISLILVGKTTEKQLETGTDEYIKRLSHYTKFDFLVIPELKNTKSLSEFQQKEKEAELILAKLKTDDFVVLLDENGVQYGSEELAGFIEKKAVGGTKNLVFIVGGPYGFHESVYQRANHKLSLSKLTFSHQMVRLIFVEQIYRAFTILKGEPYHHK